MTDPLWIGVGKAVGLPSLRTVRAVFPHTALQLLVSSSGVSRLGISCAKGEQPLRSEERIRPALVVGLASSAAGTLLLLAQDRAQASAHEAVEALEHGWCGVFEVAKPSPQRRVEVVDDPAEAVAAAADGPRPHLVLYRLQALLTHQSSTRFEPVSKELEPLARLSAVAEARLVRMQGQTV